MFKNFVRKAFPKINSVQIEKFPSIIWSKNINVSLFTNTICPTFKKCTEFKMPRAFINIAKENFLKYIHPIQVKESELGAWVIFFSDTVPEKKTPKFRAKF